MTPANLAECISHLTKNGAVAVRLSGDVLEIRDLKTERRKQRERQNNRNKYLRRKQAHLQQSAQFSGDEKLLNAAEIGLNPIEIGVNRGESGVNRGESWRPKSVEVWRGITWRDVPGRDEASRKMRFSLLKRGDWKGYKSCQYLEGDALKAAFAKITESQKAKSQKAATLRTEAAQTRNQSPA